MTETAFHVEAFEELKLVHGEAVADIASGLAEVGLFI